MGMLLFKQTGSSSTKGNHHPSFHFLELGEENCRCSQNCVTVKCVVGQNQQNIRKWIARFYYFSIYTPLAVLLIHCIELPIDMQLYLHCSLIYFSSSSCFCIVISLSEGEIILFSGVCQSGRLHYPRRRRWLQCLTTDRFDAQPTTTSGRLIDHAEHHFQL